MGWFREKWSRWRCKEVSLGLSGPSVTWERAPDPTPPRESRGSSPWLVGLLGVLVGAAIASDGKETEASDATARSDGDTS